MHTGACVLKYYLVLPLCLQLCLVVYAVIVAAAFTSVIFITVLQWCTVFSSCRPITWSLVVITGQTNSEHYYHYCWKTADLTCITGCSFKDIAIRRFGKFTMKCLFTAQKIQFLGVWSLKHFRSSRRPQKAVVHCWWDDVHVVGIQAGSLSENASVTVKSPVERMQSFFSCAHEYRYTCGHCFTASSSCFRAVEIND